MVRHKVEEVWENYLSNAIRYGGKPPRVELGTTIQADGILCFWVQDNGAGLTQPEQADLFLPFTQRGQGDRGGHGLGLSIVQRIVEKLGGRVGVTKSHRRSNPVAVNVTGLALTSTCRV